MELAPDFAVDIPLIYKYIGEVLGPLVADPSIMPLLELKKALQPLIQFNKAGVIMAEALNTVAQFISVRILFFFLAIHLTLFHNLLTFSCNLFNIFFFPSDQTFTTVLFFCLFRSVF